MPVSSSVTGVRRWFGAMALMVVVAATLAAAPSPTPVGTAGTSSKVLVYEDFWFHGEPTDQVNKVDRYAPGQTTLDARSATFDQTEPDGVQSIFQLVHGSPAQPPIEACTLAGSPCGAYWAGPFSGQVKGTMTVRLWLVDRPGPAATLTVYRDPNWSTGKATVLAQEPIPLYDLGDDRYFEVKLHVNATVKRELVIQVTNDHYASLRAVEYGSAAAASGFTLPTIVEK